MAAPESERPIDLIVKAWQKPFAWLMRNLLKQWNFHIKVMNAHRCTYNGSSYCTSWTCLIINWTVYSWKAIQSRIEQMHNRSVQQNRDNLNVYINFNHLQWWTAVHVWSISNTLCHSSCPQKLIITWSSHPVWLGTNNVVHYMVCIRVNKQQRWWIVTQEKTCQVGGQLSFL